MADGYRIGLSWQIADLTDLQIPLTQGEVKFGHVGEFPSEVINFEASTIVSLKWDYVNVNARQYIYMLGIIILAGHSRKVKHAMMRRYLRHARIMKNHLPIEARRYV